MAYIIILVVVLVAASLVLHGYLQKRSSRKTREDSTRKPISGRTIARLSPSEIEDPAKWEIVHRKSERWRELGFGDGDLFPGYGKLCERELKLWYCDVGSKTEKGVRYLRDTYLLDYPPRDFSEIAENDIYLEQLMYPKGFEALLSGLDNKNRKRWYVAVISKRPIWLEPRSALPVEENV